MTACSKCLKSITFHDSQKSRTGKFIPLDIETMKPHECSKRYIVECSHCGKQITFENDFINKKTGKRIPLTAFDGEPHNCRKKFTGLDEFFCT